MNTPTGDAVSAERLAAFRERSQQLLSYARSLGGTCVTDTERSHADHIAIYDELLTLRAERDRLREALEKLRPHAKWLKLMAAEMRAVDIVGFGNTAEWAGLAIEVALTAASAAATNEGERV